MENTNKLTGKDLINVGIYSAMTLVIFFVVGLLTSLPVVYPFLFLIWPIVCGIPMMLYYTKIRKFGMLTITGIIGGIFFYLIGYGWIGLLGWFLGGLLGDVVLKIGGYQKFKVTVLSYACFCLGIMGCPANLWFAGEAYWENIHTSMGDQYAMVLIEGKHSPSLLQCRTRTCSTSRALGFSSEENARCIYSNFAILP